MAYNYRREYLDAHKELVTKLIDLADSQASAQAEFKEAGEAHMFQYTVNNLLRSLALYFPSRAYVRNTIGTTIDYQGDKWIVGVGPIRPGKKGRKPRMVDLRPVETGGELRIEEQVTEDSWIKVVAKQLAVAKINQEVRRITILKPPPYADFIEFVAKEMAPEFDLTQTKPHMVLERVPSKNASANIAPPTV